MATISKSVAEFKAVRTTLTEADSVTVSDTSAKIKASLGALLNDVKVDQIVSTDGKEIKVAINQLGFDLSKLVKFTAADNVTVTGSSADISKSIGTFFSSEAVKHIDSTQQSYVKINVAQEQVAANMAKLLAADKISIVDTTANIQSKLSALLADAKIDLIDSSETSAINLKVADLTTANLAKLMLNDTIAVSDTTANIQANLASLLSNSKVDSINSVASTTITLSAEQLTQSNINKLSADDTIKVVLTSEDKVLTADQITLLKDAKIDSYSNAYTVSSKVADATSSLVDEGGQITFTISAIAPVEKDTTFTYQIQGDTSNAASASDVTPAFGKVTILAGQLSKSISVNAVSDGLVEFNEGAIFKLLDSTGSKQIASAPFSIQDGASYSFSAPVVSANEGSTVEFSLNTTNVADGTEISYVLSGVNVTASDFVNNSLTGTATVSGGVATISVPLANDLKTEGAETLKVTAQGKSSTVTINDTSLDANYTITANQVKADEGTDATFSIATNAADGSTVSYTLSGAGITATDVGASSLEGAVTVNGGVATITLPLSKDASTEGDEVLTLSVGGKTASTTITDKSFTPLLSPDAVVGTIDKLSGQGIAIMDASVVTGFKTNDIDSTGAVPAGTVIVDDTSETNGQLLVLANGKTAFVADDGQRKGTFEYSVAGIDGKGTVNVTINASPVYDTTSNSAAITTAEDALPITSTIKFTDADGDKLTYTFGQAAHGTVTQVADGSYTYTPNANYNGTDTFKVQVTDGYALTSTSQDVAVTVTSVNDAPQALTPAPAAIAVKSGQTGITVDLANYATDPDLAAGTITGLTFALSTATTKNGGVATLGADGHTVTINYPQNGGAAALGDDSIGFTVNDGTAAPVTATVTLNVANTEPVATDFSASVKTGITQIVDFTGKATDAEGNTLTTTVEPGSLSSGGSAEVPTTGVNAGKLVYTSTIGFVGTETMQYKVSDGFGGVSALQTISFQVASNTGGTSGNDELYGSTKAENIDGLGGNDIIVGGGGADTITGGTGNDFVTFNDDAAQILGASGVDTLVVNADAVASAFDLSLADNQNLDNLSSAIARTFENIDATKSSNDFILNKDASTTGYAAEAGGDATTTVSILTGEGNDFVNFSRAIGTGVVVKTNDGNDTIFVDNTAGSKASGSFNIDAGAGNDAINVSMTTAVHTILGGTGNDTVLLGTGLSVVDGGEGTDTISVTSATVDTTFTRLTNFEAVTVTGTTALTLDALAAAAGIKTVSETATSVQTFNVNAGFINDLTVNLNTNEPDVVAAAAYTKILTVKTTSATGLSTAVLTGGTGVADQIVYDLTAASATQAANAGITAIEKLTTTGSTTNGLNVTLANANIASTKSLTVDGSALTTGVLTVDATAESDGSVVVLGGGAADVITGSASTLGDSLSGAAGNDAFVFATLNLTLVDTVVGGDGTADAISMSDVSTVVDADFTKVMGVEVFTQKDATENMDLTLGALAMASGLNTVTGNGAADDDVTIGVGFTSALTVNIATGVDSVNGGASTAALTIAAAAASVVADDTLVGGSSANDVIKLTADNGGAVFGATVSGFETINVVASATPADDITITIPNAMVFDNTGSLTVNAAALTDSGAVLTFVSNENSTATINVNGGAGADVITAGTEKSNFSGADGNDTFVFASAAFTLDDTVAGGNGTADAISMSDVSTVVDADFTKVMGVEVFTQKDATENMDLTLGALAMASGLNTVTGNGAADDDVTIGVGFTSALTVNIATGVDSVNGGASTAALTIAAAAASVVADDTLVGGSSANDVIKLTADNGGAVFGATVSGFETINVVASATPADDITITIPNAMVFDNTGSLTVNAAALTDSGAVLTFVSNENSTATINVNGGAGADVITAGTEKSNFSGAAGDDVFNFTVTQLSSADTITGGETGETVGVGDKIVFTATADIADSIFTNATELESVTLAPSAGGNSYVFGAQASEAGIATITGGADTGLLTINASAMTTGVAINLTADAVGAAYTVAGGAAADTITLGNTSTVANFVQGNAGGDTIVLSTLGDDNVRVNLAADVATGVTLASADKVSGFEDGVGGDVIEFTGATLLSGGGGSNPLSTTIDNFGLASDVFKATALNQLSSFSTGSASTAYIILVDDVLSDATITSAVTTQAGIDQAVTFLTGNGIAATAVNAQVILGVEDTTGSNTAFFLYTDSGTTGIQSSELKLIGVYEVSVDSVSTDNFM